MRCQRRPHRCARYARRLRPVQLVQPGSVAFDAQRVAAQQVGDEAFALFDVRQRVALRRIEQAGAESQLAAGGDGWRHLQCGGDFAGDAIHPAEPAEQRHHGAAVFGDGQHRRFGALLLEQRGKGTDDDAGSAQGDDRGAVAVELAQGIAEVRVGLVGAFNSVLQAHHARLWINLLQAPGSGQCALAENDDSGAHQPFHRWPGMTIIEK